MSERSFHPKEKNSLMHFLWEKAREDGGDCYLSFQYGHMEYLSQDQRDFFDLFKNIDGTFYLKIDSRVLSLAESLYENDDFRACAYFLKLGIKVNFIDASMK